MGAERLEMSRIREVLRLRWSLALSVREAARGAGVSVGVAQKIWARAAAAGLTWGDVGELDDATLEARLYGVPVKQGDERPRPDPVEIHRELRRTGVTLELLHLLGDAGVRTDADDEIVRETLVARGGEVIHPRVREALAGGQEG